MKIRVPVSNTLNRGGLASAGKEIVIPQSAKIGQRPLNRHEKVVGKDFNDGGLMGKKDHVGKARTDHADDRFGRRKQLSLFQQSEGGRRYDFKTMFLKVANDFGLVQDVSKPIMAAGEIESAAIGCR